MMSSQVPSVTAPRPTDKAWKQKPATSLRLKMPKYSTTRESRSFALVCSLPLCLPTSCHAFSC